MRITNITWEELEPFLSKDCKQSEGSMPNHRAKFRQLTLWFQEKDFNRKNFTIFLHEREKIHKDKNATLNNYIKFVKHFAKYLGKEVYEELKDFSYMEDEPTQPENYLSYTQITKLAETKMKYKRYPDRKHKYKALIYFLGNIGSRIDETVKLEWRDIIFGEITMIHFRKEIVKGRKKERFCAIPKWLLKMLLSLPKENAFIFNIDVSRFREDLIIRSKECKILFHVSPHVFRDSSINNKLEGGMPIQEVAGYHGHVNIETTFRYYTNIQARKVAQSLQKYDLAFKDEQTYDTNTEGIKTTIESLVNPKISDYIFQQSLTDKNKRKITIELLER